MPTFNYPYDAPGDYTYDSDKIEIVGGLARIKQNLTNVYARWHMNESTGTLVSDDSGNSRNGTGQNIDASNWVTGHLNNCLSLNGTDEYVDNGSIAGFEYNEPFSCMAWIKTTDTTSTNMAIISKGGIGNQGWAMTYHPSAGNLDITLVNTASTNLITVRVTGVGGTLSNGSWHMVGFTYDGTSAASGVTVYIDGSSQTTSTIDDTLSATIITSTSCQTGAATATDLWNGDLDEVVVWDMEITGANVTYMYNTGTGREEWYYWTDKPTIEPTNLLAPGHVTDWTAFTETLGGGNEGSIVYNLYKNTKNHKYYWSGAMWSDGGNSTNSNTAAVVNDNIDDLDISPQGIGFVAYLISNGEQEVELDLNSISYDQADASIQPTDIHFYESVNMTDDDASGGIMSNNQIACGTLNNIFPNISRLDRLYGRVQFRKIYVKVDSDNLDVYSGAHIAIKDIPFDPNVSIVFLASANPAETRLDLMPTLEDFYEVGEIAGDARVVNAVNVGESLITFQTDLINRSLIKVPG